LDRGNSIYDIRHRLVVSHVWQLPGQNLHGFAGQVVGGWFLNGTWAYQTGAHWQPFNSHRSKLREISDPTAHCTAADIPLNCQNLSGDYLLTTSQAGGIGRSNARPDSSVSSFGSFSHDTWANGWCPGGDVRNGPCSGGTYTQNGLPVFTAPCLGCAGNLGLNTFVGRILWESDLAVA